MALTTQQQNFCIDLMNYGAQLLAEIQQGESLKARWFNNTFSGIADGDLAAFPATAHLTQAKLAGAITAIQALLTAFGDDVSGQQINIIKLKG